MNINNPPGAALKTKVISFTRDMTAASGAVAYTGVGFKPAILVLLAALNDGAYVYASWGLATGNGAGGIREYRTATAVQLIDATVYVVKIEQEATTHMQEGGFTSFDADGFTLTWTKTGTPSGTATIKALCVGLE